MLFYMKILVSFLLLFFAIPQGNPEKMEWDEHRILTWNDFQAVPDKSASFVASTNSGISFSYSYTTKNGKIDFTYSVASFFYPKKSWFKPTEVDDYILKHEQTHFDISELHARKLRKSIDNATFSKNLKTEIESLYNVNEKVRRAMQQKFDKETDHSKKRKEEVRWENYVAQQLREYARWK